MMSCRNLEWFIYQHANQIFNDNIYQCWTDIQAEMLSGRDLEIDEQTTNFIQQGLVTVCASFRQSSTANKQEIEHMGAIIRLAIIVPDKLEILHRYIYYSTKIVKTVSEDIPDEDGKPLAGETQQFRQTLLMGEPSAKYSLKSLVRKLPVIDLELLDIPIEKKMPRSLETPKILPSEWRELIQMSRINPDPEFKSSLVAGLNDILRMCTRSNELVMVNWPVWDDFSQPYWADCDLNLIGQQMTIRGNGGILHPKIEVIGPNVGRLISKLSIDFWSTTSNQELELIDRIFCNLVELTIGRLQVDANVLQIISRFSKLVRVNLISDTLPFQHHRQSLVELDKWELCNNQSIESLVVLSKDLISDAIYELSNRWTKLVNLVVNDAIFDRVATEVYSKRKPNGTTDLHIGVMSGEFEIIRPKPIKCLGMLRDEESGSFFDNLSRTKQLRNNSKKNSVSELSEQEYMELLQEFGTDPETLEILHEMRNEASY